MIRAYINATTKAVTRAVIPGSWLKQNYIKRVLAIHPDNIVAFWGFNEIEGTVLNDYFANVQGTIVNPTFNQDGIGDGNKSIGFASGRGIIDLSSLDARWTNKNEFTVITWVKNTKTNWDDSNYKYIFYFTNASESVAIIKNNNPGDFRVRYNTSVGNLYAAATVSTDEWVCVGMIVDKTTNEIRAYVNGIHRTKVTADGSGTWGEDPLTAANISSRYATSRSLGWDGLIGPTVIFNGVVSDTKMALLSSYKNVRGILFIGDSKTRAESWRHVLCDLLSDSKNVRYTEIPPRIGVDGIGTQGMKNRCDADIAAMAGVQAPVEISIALGANDASGGVLAADWNMNMRYILNAYHTAFPDANIRLTKPWRSTYTSVMVEIGTLIDAIYADYTWLKPGIDEFDILPGEDNGATYTTDGVHPNADGGALIAEALFNVMK